MLATTLPPKIPLPTTKKNRFARLRQSLSMYRRGKSSPDLVTSESQEDATAEDREPTSQQPSDSPEISQLPLSTPPDKPRALKILFLSSDTGGGHRASATSLAQQFSVLFPGSIHALCDIVQLDGPPPYNSLVRTYKHLSCHPAQWKLVYSISNSRAYEMLADVHMKSAMERSVRKRIMSYNPDVVVSVHPLMTNVPVLACSNISKETGMHLPIFTVCTDLGSGHTFWFANGVEKLFVASEAIKELAKQRGKVPDDKIVMSGLPIRNDFSVQASQMGDRHSDGGKVYQKSVRDSLGLRRYRDSKIVLVMGGGEGCGRLGAIVDSLYLQFVEQNMNAVILVVCGRNETLKEQLAKKNWKEMRSTYTLARQSGVTFEGCVGLLADGGCGTVWGSASLRRIISSPSMLGIGRVENPFSPVNNTKVPDGENSSPNFKEVHTTSLPGSRSNSPIIEASESIEVVTKSCADRENLHESADEDDKTANKKTYKATKTETSETQMMTSSQSSEDEIEIVQESVSNEVSQAGVKVVGLGFITNMADYMVATDVLVSKAGPGTIAEAAALSLPVMLTSFLPGQEEGNVDYVVEGQFGAYISDQDPQSISEEVASWIASESKLRELSANAKLRGAPDAAAEIVHAIGESALRWKKINEEHLHELTTDGSTETVDDGEKK